MTSYIGQQNYFYVRTVTRQHCYCLVTIVTSGHDLLQMEDTWQIVIIHVGISILCKAFLLKLEALYIIDDAFISQL